MKKRILITGASGVLGTALQYYLSSQGKNVVLFCPSSNELNLLDADKTREYLMNVKPDEIYHLASIVYGLQGNLDNQWKAIHLNTKINDNFFNVCIDIKPKKIFYASTVAAYPDGASNPLREAELFEGLPHWGEYGYAFAKRHAYGYLEILKHEFGIPYVYGIFTNIYGPNDRFNIKTGHVIPSLLYKAFLAAEKGGDKFEILGNPRTTRDFIYSMDAAEAAVLAMERTTGSINIASGVESSIGQVVNIITDMFPGIVPQWINQDLVGINKRSVDISLLKEIGWQPKVNLKEGLWLTKDWMCKFKENLRI